MNRPDLQELMQNIESLPAVVRDVINSPEMGAKIDEIAGKSNLKETQLNLLIDEVAYVIFKITPISEFKKTIQENLGLLPSQALAISSEIYGSIFVPIKRYLKDVDDVDQTTKIAYTNKPSAPAKKILPSNESNRAVPSAEDVQIDLDSDALNHRDILSEIENPTPSINSDHKNIPEESLVELENHKEVTSNENESAIEKPTQGSISNQHIVSNPYADLSRLRSNSVHHDIVPNLSAFKPLPENTQPVDNHLSSAEKTAQKLEDKLTGVVSTETKEVYMPHKTATPRENDPYRESI